MMVLLVPTTMETVVRIWLLTALAAAMAWSDVLKSASGNGTKNCCTICPVTWALALFASPNNTRAAKYRASLSHVKP